MGHHPIVFAVGDSLSFGSHLNYELLFIEEQQPLGHIDGGIYGAKKRQLSWVRIGYPLGRHVLEGVHGKVLSDLPSAEILWSWGLPRSAFEVFVPHDLLKKEM